MCCFFLSVFNIHRKYTFRASITNSFHFNPYKITIFIKIYYVYVNIKNRKGNYFKYNILYLLCKSFFLLNR